MSWFWLNIPLCALFFAATAGIPLYLVLRDPRWSASADHAQLAPADSAHLTPIEAPTVEQLPELAGVAY